MNSIDRDLEKGEICGKICLFSINLVLKLWERPCQIYKTINTCTCLWFFISVIIRRLNLKSEPNKEGEDWMRSVMSAHWLITVKIWIWSSLSRSKLIGSTRIWTKSKGTWMQSVFKKKKKISGVGWVSG